MTDPIMDVVLDEAEFEAWFRKHEESCDGVGSGEPWTEAQAFMDPLGCYLWRVRYAAAKAAWQAIRMIAHERVAKLRVADDPDVS